MNKFVTVNKSRTVTAHGIFNSIDDTVKPRLEKAGADCSMIRVIDETEKELCMTDDRLEKAIVETGARLIILDPIQAYIGPRLICTEPMKYDRC